MKTFLIKSLSLIVLMLLITIGINAQDSLLVDTAGGIVIDTIVTPPGQPPTGDITLPLLSEWFQQGIGPAVSLLMIAITYLSDRIPILKKIDDVGLRLIAFGFLIGAAYLFYPGQDVWKAATSYVGALLLYHIALRPLGARGSVVRAKLAPEKE